MSLACPCEATAGADALRVRDLCPGEEAALLEIFDGLGTRSRQLRFLAPKTRLTSADLRHLSAVDGHAHVAVVAEAGPDSRPVGVARFVRDQGDPGTADVAVTVVDDWQRRGVGTLLSTALARRARQVGVRRLTMAMLVENDGAVRLLHRMHGRIDRLEIDEGVAEFALTLSEPTSAPWRPRLLTGGAR
jgi:GNAT superfamily N-acetyltransferase